jgi:hypothetical protein
VGCGDIEDYGEPGSYEVGLDALAQRDLLIDTRVRAVAPDPLPAGRHSLGDGIMDIRRQFPALVYQQTAPKMTPLRWPSCQWRVTGRRRHPTRRWRW